MLDDLSFLFPKKQPRTKSMFATVASVENDTLGVVVDGSTESIEAHKGVVVNVGDRVLCLLTELGQLIAISQLPAEDIPVLPDMNDVINLPQIPPKKVAGLYCNARLRDTEDAKNIPAAVTQIFMELQDHNQISWTEGGINKTAQFIFNDGKIVVPAGVSLVLVSAGMTFTATGNVNLNLYIRKNNVNFANAIRRPYDSATPIQHLVTGAHVVSVTEGDEISLVAFGASTVSLAATTIVGRNYLSIAALA